MTDRERGLTSTEGFVAFGKLGFYLRRKARFDDRIKGNNENWESSIPLFSLSLLLFSIFSFSLLKNPNAKKHK